MSLFGLFATVFTGGVLLKEAMKDSAFNDAQRMNAKKTDALTWTDSHGREYLTATGEQVYRHNMQLRTLKTDRLIVDYEKRSAQNANKRALEYAKVNNKKYAQLVYPEFKGRTYYTELSTMKRYYLKAYEWSGEKKYYKVYYPKNEMSSNSKDELKGLWEKVQISKEEFNELGGGYVGGNLYTDGLYYS